MELKKILSKNEWIVFSIILVAGLFLRWYNLDVRPIHHDESLNAIYGQYFYNNATTGYYKYNPMLHGPLLYHILPFIYQALDVSKFAIRFLPCLLGSLFIFAPLLFHRFFQSRTVLFQCFLIALSPSLIYWSRFLRHDYLVISSIIIMLAGICFTRSYKSFFFLIGLALHFCIKENVFITMALLMGYLAFDMLINKFSKKSLFFKTLQYCLNYKLQTICGLALSVLIFSYFYTAGFQYSQGILDGLYRKSFLYWFNQHSISRISGPFIYQFLTLTWYDLFFVILLFTHVIHFYKRAQIKERIIFLASFVPAIFGYKFFGSVDLSFFKIIIPSDLLLFTPLIAHSLIVTFKHHKENNTLLAFLGYFFFATFFTYSFVGEKVPWLSLYILLTGIPYLTYYFQDRDILRRLEFIKIKKLKVIHFAFVIIFLFNLRIAVMTNFTRAGKDTEFISQVHTSDYYEKTLFKIKEEINYAYKSSPPKILDYEENTWPLTWYFLNMPEFEFNKRGKNLKKYDYIFAGQNNANLDFELLESHNKTLIPLRQWWVPDYNKMSLTKILNYSINHKPWNPTGKKFIALYSKRINGK